METRLLPQCIDAANGDLGLIDNQTVTYAPLPPPPTFHILIYRSFKDGGPSVRASLQTVVYFNILNPGMAKMKCNKVPLSHPFP